MSTILRFPILRPRPPRNKPRADTGIADIARAAAELKREYSPLLDCHVKVIEDGYSKTTWRNGRDDP